jgi:sortase A
MPGHDCVYSVTGTQIVTPTDLWVIDPTPKPTVTLIACHPKHSAAQRIVVKGDLIADIPVKT